MNIHLLVSVATVFVLALILGCGSEPSDDKSSGNTPADSDGISPLKFVQDGANANGKAAAALDLFNKRILPIFNSTKPSSCTECHLSAVELRDYIKPDQEETFAALVAAELIDVKKPDDSKILEFIRRAPEEGSLVSKKVREEEYAAFQAWIHAAVKDPALLTAKPGAAIGPDVPVEVVRHSRKDRVLDSFVDNVWSEVLRCAACHSPDRNQKQVEKFGDQVSWITISDPRATMEYMVDAEIINVAEPAKSRLLTKPTLQEEHGGGQKLMIGDRTYRQFLRFIEDYAAVVKGEYESSEDLPAESEEVSEATDIWLKVIGVPARFDKLLLRADVHRWDDARGEWSEQRFATADRAVFGPNKLWQNHLTLTAPRGSDRAKTLRGDAKLAAGRYLVKIYVDEQSKLVHDETAELNEEDLVGEVEINSRWPEGYGQMTEVRFP